VPECSPFPTVPNRTSGAFGARGLTRVIVQMTSFPVGQTGSARTTIILHSSPSVCMYMFPWSQPLFVLLSTVPLVSAIVCPLVHSSPGLSHCLSSCPQFPWSQPLFVLLSPYLVSSVANSSYVILTGWAGFIPTMACWLVLRTDTSMCD
jgi:hypothetical protein